MFVPDRLSDLPFLALLSRSLGQRPASSRRPGSTFSASAGSPSASWDGRRCRWRGPIALSGRPRLLRQCEFFLVALYAANAVESKGTLKRMWLILLLVVLVQESTTIFRFTFDYYSFFGDLFGPHGSAGCGRKSSSIHARAGWAGFAPNSFRDHHHVGGTTGQLLLLVLPLAAFACTRNPVFRRRFACALVIFRRGWPGARVPTHSREKLDDRMSGGTDARRSWFAVRRFVHLSGHWRRCSASGLLAL